MYILIIKHFCIHRYHIFRVIVTGCMNPTESASSASFLVVIIEINIGKRLAFVERIIFYFKLRLSTLTMSWISVFAGVIDITVGYKHYLDRMSRLRQQKVGTAVTRWQMAAAPQHNGRRTMAGPHAGAAGRT